VERALAVVYTLVLHAALWFPITALGLYYMAREGVSWGTELDQARAEG
jgi:hypothetical protein